MRNRIGSPRKAKAEIGFEADIPLDDGLQRLIVWRKTHKEEVAGRRGKAARLDVRR